MVIHMPPSAKRPKFRAPADFYIVETGWPADSILCGACLRIAPGLAGFSFSRLDDDAIKAVLREDPSYGCEICGAAFRETPDGQ